MTRLVLEVAKRAHALNQALFRDHPKGNLSPREVHHIAKSVAKWTYNRYQGARVYPVSSTGRPDRSRLSPQARALIPPLQARGERITATALAREAGVHRNTAAKWLKRMRQ